MYMHGIFKSSPHLYQQIYSLHSSYKDIVVPLVYTLLSTKSRQSYHDMLSKVHDRMAELDLVFNPATIISDFESVIIPAMRHLFPVSQHRGCYCHHTATTLLLSPHTGCVAIGTNNWTPNSPRDQT